MLERKIKCCIVWNTGDMYWDDFPYYEEFFGTVGELIEYLFGEFSCWWGAGLEYLHIEYNLDGLLIEDLTEEVFYLEDLELEE